MVAGLNVHINVYRRARFQPGNCSSCERLVTISELGARKDPLKIRCRLLSPVPLYAAQCRCSQCPQRKYASFQGVIAIF